MLESHIRILGQRLSVSRTGLKTSIQAGALGVDAHNGIVNNANLSRRSYKSFITGDHKLKIRSLLPGRTIRLPARRGRLSFATACGRAIF